MGLQLFLNQIAHHPRIKDRLLKHLLANIERERHGEVINRGLLRSLILMLVELGINERTVYEEDFEKRFLEVSAQFYKVESQEFISRNSCSDYMKKVELRIKEEMDRVQHYLDAQTEPKIKEIVDRELISQHMETLVKVLHSQSKHTHTYAH
jgi:cullin 3